MMNFQLKERYDFDDLMEIVALLRSPEGCPWDMRQDHHSIRANLIEETYEVIDAIDRDDRAALQEELGDLLLQVVFHTEMEREVGGFAMDDVTDGICKKLIERHPHVFGIPYVGSDGKVRADWEEIKKASKGQRSQTEAMRSIPKGFPALLRASKLRSKAVKANYDVVTPRQAADELQGMAAELRQYADTLEESHDTDAKLDICGRLLFSAVKVSYALGIDSEHALAAACDEFINEFSQTEELANSRNIDLKISDCAEVESLRGEACSKSKPKNKTTYMEVQSNEQDRIG